MIRGERGTASLELALVGPVLMLLIVGVLQFGLWYHARQVVQTASQEAARVAAAEQGDVQEGRVRAMQVLESGLSRSTESASAEVDIGPDVVRARVEVTMRGLLPIPGLSSLTFASETTSYREVFREGGG